MSCLRLVLSLAWALTATQVSAATFTWTEGNGHNRKLVFGSTDLADADQTAPGYALNSFADGGPGRVFGSSDILQIHGRIVSSRDVFTYVFEMTRNFIVMFDLDGYRLDAYGLAGSLETRSGLVGQDGRGGDPLLGAPSKTVRFELSDGVEVQERTFETDVVPGDDAYIFTGSANTPYSLTVDGSIGPGRKRSALYDLRIQAVPLPAAGWLLIAGLCGMATIRKRHRG